jgi:acyl-CoA-binding protein
MTGFFFNFAINNHPEPMEKEVLEKEFWKQVEIGNQMPTQTADNMLIAYGYFKQATEGDNIHPRPNESSNVIQTFKHNSWSRLQGMSKENAMKNYIAHIQKMIEETIEEGRM